MSAEKLQYRLALESIDDSNNAGLQEWGVEVDQVAEPSLSQAKIRQELLLMGISEELNAFDFDQQLSFYDEIGSEGFLEDEIAVCDRDGHLPFDSQFPFT